MWESEPTSTEQASKKVPLLLAKIDAESEVETDQLDWPSAEQSECGNAKEEDDGDTNEEMLPLTKTRKPTHPVPEMDGDQGDHGIQETVHGPNLAGESIVEPIMDIEEDDDDDMPPLAFGPKVLPRKGNSTDDGEDVVMPPLVCASPQAPEQEPIVRSEGIDGTDGIAGFKSSVADVDTDIATTDRTEAPAEEPADPVSDDSRHDSDDDQWKESSGKFLAPLDIQQFLFARLHADGTLVSDAQRENGLYEAYPLHAAEMLWEQWDVDEVGPLDEQGLTGMLRWLADNPPIAGSHYRMDRTFSITDDCSDADTINRFLAAESTHGSELSGCQSTSSF